MSNTIVVMKDGVIQQVGSPMDIYNEPANAFVADFIGNSNIYNATMVGPKVVRFINANFPCDDDFPLNEKVDVVIRPEDVEIVPSGKGMVEAKIVNKIFKGVHFEYVVMVGKNEVVVQGTKDFAEAEPIGLVIDPESIHVMKKEFTINSYYDAWINKNNQVVISNIAFDCDVTKLVPQSTLDQDGYVVSKKGVRYDFNDAEVVAEIQFGDIELSDDISQGQTTGTVVSLLYIGDHYQYTVRTEDEEDFVVDTQYVFNENDVVSINVASKHIQLRIKGDIAKYEL
jgi:spermidine/putrescine transport system ATP-binding protein